MLNSLIKGLSPRDTKGLLLRVLVFETLICSMHLGINSQFAWNEDTWARNTVFSTILVSTPVVVAMNLLLKSQRTLHRTLVKTAATDALTGLPNRRSFLDRAAKAMSETGGVVMMLDVDHFKRVNDTYGHTVGDICLKAIADHIRHNIRRGDILGRLGGEEFGVYLADVPVDQARRIGERLAAGVTMVLSEMQEDIEVTMSVGAVTNAPQEVFQQAMARADTALYRAKSGGRARLVLWDEATATTPA